MSGIDDLLKELCPKGVPYKRIGDVASVGTGSSDRKDATEDGEYPFYVRSKEIRRKDSYEFDEEAILIPGEGGIGEIFHHVNGKYALHQRAYRISFKTPDINAKFAYYYFQTSFKKFILAKAVNATVSSIRKPMITDFKIPVPPAEVQREIVQLLDQFGGLATELAIQLEAELEARQRQYAHYRNDLFAFRDVAAVERVPMGEVGEFIRGRRFTKDDVVYEGIPSIHYGEIYTTYGIASAETVSHVREGMAAQLRYAKPGDVVIAAVGETVEDVGKAVAWLGTTDVAIHDDCFLYRSSVLEPKFVSYFMRTEALNREKAKYVARAKVKRLSGENLAKLVIPAPPRDEQERIVGILDELDALVTDLSAALPAELNARRKQYEYCRDRLLTFEDLAA